MFYRKLAALGYPHKTVDCNDDLQFRNVVVWLEDHKIRLYKIENRKVLKDIKSKTWNNVFKNYLNDLNFPFLHENREEVFEWLLGHAIRMEYGDDIAAYEDTSGKAVNAKRIGGSSAIQSINESDAKFKEAVRSFAKILKIPLHENDVVTLRAVVLFVEERLSEKGLKNYTNKSNKNSVPLQQIELGFDTGEDSLNNAARALRLLHINDLRQLQTDINDAVVSVQSITADPKTDQRLGKVGRS